MKKLHLLILSVFISLFISHKVFAQAVSTEGKAFWVSFMEVAANGTPSYQLFITSKTSTSGTARVPLTGWVQNFTVAANQTTIVIVPNANAQVTGSETVQNRGIHISSLADISVYAVMRNDYRTEASVVLPISSLGGTTEYIVNTYPPTANNGATSRSEFVIVGMKDDTDIVITPTVTTRGNKPANTPFTIQLDSGQVYQVQSKLGTEGVPADLSGTTIVGANGCKPFSVFSGATAARVPSSCSAAWQHLYEQNYPVKTWGRDYLVIPFANMSYGFAYKIVASENNTVVNIKVGSNPATVVNLNKGQTYDGEVNQSMPFGQGTCINSNNPISVAQFMKGQGCNGVPPIGNKADPSMLMLNPTNQTVKKVTFNTISTPGGDIVDAHYVNIIVKNINTNKIKLQGNLLGSSAFQPIQACTGYSYAQIDLVPYGIDPVSGASFTIESDSTFIAYAYGYGNASAYAYSAGASFENQLYNFNTSAGTVCIGTTVSFTGFGTNITSYTWDFGDGSPTKTGQTVTHLYGSIGTYNVRMTVTTTDGCGTDYILKPYEILPFPAPTLGSDRNICPNTSTVLNPTNSTLTVGSPTYQWLKDGTVIVGATLPTLTINQAGTYKVNITNAGGCAGTDEVIIGTHAVGAVDIVGLNTSYCINSPSVTLAGTPAGGTFTVKGAPATVFNPISTGIGTHKVIYSYTDVNSCINRDTLNVTVNPLPVVAITGLQSQYCAINTRIPLVGTPAGGSFTINEQTYTNNNIKLDSLAAGTYNIKYSYTDMNNCLNTDTKTIVIDALPALTFLNLQDSYCIDFLPMPQGKLLEASPAGGNFTINGNNTPVFAPHLLGVGAHTITYTYTDNKNCTNTISKVVTLNPLPTPVINLQTAYCKGQGLVTLQATPMGGSFTLNGASAVDFNTFNMALGDYEVIYTYTDANTCLQRDTLEFSIEESPIVSITGLQFVYCIDAAPFNLTATPAPVNPLGFGIFRINGGLPVTQVNPSLLGAGTHTVEYTYTDNKTNCVVVQNKTFEVSGLPSVSLVSIGGLKDSYCLNSPAFALSGIGNPSGGVFTVSGIIRTIFNPSEIGAGLHTVIYNFQNANGCFNTASKDVLIYPGEIPSVPNLKNNYCVQNTAFNLVGEPAGGTFRIDGVLINTPTPLFSPSVLGVGEHTIVYKTLTACDSVVRKINVFDAPTKLNYVGLEMCSFSGDTIVLDAGVGAKYEWSNFKTTQTIKIIQSGKYTVTVTDTLGCLTISEIDIAEKCEPQFYLPTAFTPNSDGLNDALKIFGQDFYKLEFKVFNRWGEQVFYSTKKTELWDGMIAGKPAPAGVYVCTIKYLERPNAKEKQLTRYINVIR